MRRLALLLVAALAACGNDPTSPTPMQGTDDSTLTADAAFFGGGFGAGGMLRRLPANLALTDAQKTQIQGYARSFWEASKADREALVAILKQARDARRSGATRERIQAILQQAAPIRQRLQAARAQLRSQIDGVLTADQKAWLAANAPKRCDRSTAPALTDAQKTQIRALVTAFAQANRTDLQAVRQAFAQARQARRSGAGPDRVKAILEAVKPAAERVKTAREKLNADIQALLTPEQAASGCYTAGAALRMAIRARLGQGMLGPGTP